MDVREEIRNLVREKNCGPILIRLSWHDAGTFDASNQTGGAHACMRFQGNGESTHGANNGLTIAQNLLAPIREKYTDISTADLWALSAVVAIEEMGGPIIPFRYGRTDAQSVDASVEEGRLPDAAKGTAHLRNIFYRMGFNDQEIVALSGAHSVGHCHKDRSGFDGSWSTEPYKFDNSYFIDLLDTEFEEVTVDDTGNRQFFNKEKSIMMLPTDIALIHDEKFKTFVMLFAENKEMYFEVFTAAFQKLQEFGLNLSQSEKC